MNSTANVRIRVLIVDDHKVVRIGLREILSDCPDIDVVGEAASATEAMTQVRCLTPDVVLLDTRLPGPSGLAVCRQIKDELPRVRVLVLTSFADDNTILTAVRAGADGYLLKDVNECDVIDGIRRIHRGGAVLAPEATRAIAAAAEHATGLLGPLDRLTGQERRVCELAAGGQNNNEIAVALNLSEKTVRNYLTHAFEKLDVKRRSQLAPLFLGDRR